MVHESLVKASASVGRLSHFITSIKSLYTTNDAGVVTALAPVPVVTALSVQSRRGESIGKASVALPHGALHVPWRPIYWQVFVVTVVETPLKPGLFNAAARRLRPPNSTRLQWH